MMFRIFAAFALLAASSLHAQTCGGRDLRPDLTPAERAAITEAIANVPYAEGNFWTATRGDRTLTLIGTLHVSDPRMEAMVDKIDPILSAADVLLVEATPEGEADLQRYLAENPEIGFITSGPTLIELLPPDVWTEVKNAAQSRGVPGFMAAKLKPWQLSLLLSIPPCALASLRAGEHGLDKRLIDLADTRNVPVAQLEDPRLIIDLFAREPLETQLGYIQTGILDDAVAEDAFRTLAEQYFEGAHMEALELARLIAAKSATIPEDELNQLFDEVMQILLDDRNTAWIDVIEATEGDDLVLAFGALHLGGEAGVLSLLEARGYSIKALAD